MSRFAQTDAFNDKIAKSNRALRCGLVNHLGTSSALVLRVARIPAKRIGCRLKAWEAFLRMSARVDAAARTAEHPCKLAHRFCGAP
jgi:hypothetical protein